MKPLFIIALVLLAESASSQFRNDNVSYKTIDPALLCDELKKNKGYMLLDVRSAGEYADTSQAPGYNLGHLENAININVRELGKRLPEINAYRDKPVFVYCSHSQRSRRAAKMLADSGFTRVYNINGGVSSFYYRELDQQDCLDKLLVTKNKYEIISFHELGQMLRKGNVFVLDVRPDSAFRHITNDPKVNAYGTVKGAVNIPLEKLASNHSAVPKSANIVITDIYGDEAAKAAVWLIEQGYPNVAVLIEGVDRVLFTNQSDIQFAGLYVSPVSYQMITSAEFGEFVSNAAGFTLLDVRTPEEFSNKHKDSWRNIGHLKNAVHIPAGEVAARLSELDKTKPIIIYGIGSGTEVHATAELLQKNGFSRVIMIVGGLFNLRWTAGNVRGQEHLAKLVTDIPEENR